MEVTVPPIPAAQMDLYISSLLLGVIGLAAMALSGLGSHGHSGHGNAGHGGHAGHTGHTGSHSHFGHTHAGANAHGVLKTGGRSPSSFLWSIMSPRFLFSFALG